MRKRLLLIPMIILGMSLLYYNFRPARKYPVTFQQRIEHMAVFLEDGKPKAQCTVTAVGPHAILTAEHCKEKDNPGDTIRLDLSTKDYHVVIGIIDGRDHTILLLDGPAFKNYAPASSLLAVKPVGIDELVYIYGNGGWQYPGRYLTGRVDIKAQNKDTSEVDTAQEATWFTFSVISGDSGSAVFGSDGRIVSVISLGNETGGAVGFSLAYTKKTIDIVQSFSMEDLAKGLR